MKTDHRRRGALSRLAGRLRGDARGNVAMIFALGLPALVMLTGMGIDLYRADVARNTSQQAVDAAALAAASSREKTQAGLARVASNYMNGNVDLRYLTAAPDPETKFIDDIKVEVSMKSTVKTIFMGMIGVSEMPVNVTATAIRGAAEEVELALVLDNTWSMSFPDARGISKISALKSAASDLVRELMQRDGARVKIGVVPYADYVNVGKNNFGQSWLDVAELKKTVTTERPCGWTNTHGPQVCTPDDWRWTTCSETNDGITITTPCQKNFRTCSRPEKPKEEWIPSCPGPAITRTYWHGCVYSRVGTNLRLTDEDPSSRYQGIMESNEKESRTCLNPILPLTNQRGPVLTTVQNLIVNRDTYKPSTYIPAGMIWGVNVLSPTAPFVEGGAYHVANRDPRKIMVLMTDGANTMYFNADGRHLYTDNAARRTATDNDTQAICTYAKSKKIEVFTVALAVDSTSARRMLENCASSKAHYFDASDTVALADAFQEIAASINRVRLIN